MFKSRWAGITLCFFTQLLFLTGCAGTVNTDVTRFHHLEQPKGQSLRVDPANPAMGGLEFASYAQMVGEKLGARGFIAPTSSANPKFIAKIDYGMAPAPHAARSPEPSSSVGIGVGSWGGGVGLSTGVTFPIGKPREQPLPKIFFLQLCIYDGDNPMPVFEGRAETVAEGQDMPAMMPYLVDAMFKDFPGQSGKTITVKANPGANR